MSWIMANNEKSLPIHYLCAAPRFIGLDHISPQPLIFENYCMGLSFCEIHSVPLIKSFVLHPQSCSPGRRNLWVVMSVRYLRCGHTMVGGLRMLCVLSPLAFLNSWYNVGFTDSQKDGELILFAKCDKGLCFLCKKRTCSQGNQTDFI